MTTDMLMLQKQFCKLLILLVAFTLAQSGCAVAQELDPKKEYTVANIGFYNLENLFDTIVDPDTTKILQDEFTPEGKNAWTGERYRTKLDKLAEVISQIGTDITPDGLAVLGVSEIENREVLEDLVKTEKLKKFGYEIVHFHSPDRRGIDVGLLYQPKYFQVTSTSSIPLVDPENPRFITRDQLLVSGLLDGEEFHFVVAHWPSRRGGQKRSAPRRNFAGQVGRSIVDSIMQVNPKAKIIYMGDLNDDPKDESVRKHLRSGKKPENLEPGELYNPMAKLFDKGIGTLAWRDTWNLFDQLIMTQEVLNHDSKGFWHYRTKVFNKPFLKTPSGNFAGYPFRTFAGGRYQGGYSDHFPVYTILVKEK